MRGDDRISGYCGEVCGRIRWKKARAGVEKELRAHLSDARDAYMSRGIGEDDAASEAIRDMGTPDEVGLLLDKVHRPRPQPLLIALTIALMAVGAAANLYFSGGFFSIILPYIAAAGIFIACGFADFTLLARRPAIIYAAVVCAALLAVFFAGSANGRLTLELFGGRISVGLETFALILPVAYALLVYSLRGRGYAGIALAILGFIPCAAFMLIVPSAAGLVVLTLACAPVLELAAAKGWFGVRGPKPILLSLTPAAGAAGLCCLYMSSPVMVERLRAALDPSLDPNGRGYMATQVRGTLSGASAFGSGASASGGGQYALPGGSTYYMLTSLARDFGWIAFAAVAILLAALVVFAFKKLDSQKNMLGALVAQSCALVLASQTALYLASNLGIDLFGTLSLPFVSQGNAALLIDAALAGMLLSVFRTGGEFSDTPIQNPA